MKCREAQYWLYSFQPNAAWPSDVVGHLQGCPECQQLQRELRQIDQGINTLTNLPSSEAAINVLLQRIEQTPQSGSVAAASPQRPPWAWVGMYLSGMAALVAVGAMIGLYLASPREPETRTVEVIREKPIEVEIVRERVVERIVEKVVPVVSDRNLYAALLRRNAELVKATVPSEGLDTLLDMADDCRQHALTLFEDGPRESLPMAVDLYTLLLREGVLANLAQAPAPTQSVLASRARTRLGKMAELDVPKTPIKALSDQFALLQDASRKTMDDLDQLEAIKVPQRAMKPQRADPIAPTTALVRFAIAYTSESDPVVKADACADYVQRLTPSVMLCLADEGLPQRVEMGQQFGELIQFGIYRPIAAVTAAEPPATMKAQADQIMKNADQTVATMKKHLELAPAATKSGFERALEATRKNPGKGKGKGKGPPGKALSMTHASHLRVADSRIEAPLDLLWPVAKVLQRAGSVSDGRMPKKDSSCTRPA